MVDVAQVNLYGRPIGYVRWDSQYGIARFEYDTNFTKTGIQPSPFLMPAREDRIYSFGELNRETFSGLPEMLADSLPDTYGRASMHQMSVNGKFDDITRADISNWLNATTSGMTGR